MVVGVLSECALMGKGVCRTVRRFLLGNLVGLFFSLMFAFAYFLIVYLVAPHAICAFLSGSSIDVFIFIFRPITCPRILLLWRILCCYMAVGGHWCFCRFLCFSGRCGMDTFAQFTSRWFLIVTLPYVSTSGGYIAVFNKSDSCVAAEHYFTISTIYCLRWVWCVYFKRLVSLFPYARRLIWFPRLNSTCRLFAVILLLVCFA